MSKLKLGIVGYGAFTKLLIKYLSPQATILVHSRNPDQPKDGLKFNFADVKNVLGQDIVIPSIPAHALEGFFETNKQHLNPKALIVDVCSVKTKPIEVLKRVLPPDTEILATHPLFGPTSAANGLEGKRIMMYPARLPKDRYLKIKSFLQSKLKLQIIECSPKEHDKVMAYAQGLSHYIGRLMQIMDIPESPLTTDAYDDLKDMKQVQGSDSWELFKSIMFDNPYTLEVNKDFKQAIKKLDAKLDIR